MLQVKEVSFSYGKDKNFYFDGIESNKDTSLILGPSGCGKTTLLHLMAGILKPKEGQIIWDSVDINQLSSHKRDKLRGETVSIIFQKPYFIQSWNVEENIKSQALINGKSIKKIELDNLLLRLNIKHLIKKKTRDLSEGEKQRVSIARAIVNKPKFLLADEPTSALDDENAMQVLELLTSEASRFGAQVMIITHDQRLKNKIENRIEL